MEVGVENKGRGEGAGVGQNSKKGVGKQYSGSFHKIGVLGPIYQIRSRILRFQ